MIPRFPLVAAFATVLTLGACSEETPAGGADTSSAPAAAAPAEASSGQPTASGAAPAQAATPSPADTTAPAAPAAVAENASDALKGRSFVLQTANGEPAEFPGRQPSLEFDADLRMTGQVCNRFMGVPRFEDGVLKAEVAATRMLCIDRGLDDLENTFFFSLADGMPYTFDGQTLVLKGKSGDFVFHAVESLPDN
ncbi:META domain-containing protein [Phaeovibrio sulfidiphilus]|uniref:META domain-containing protein n=1 Tax=Phaeovibrio sulfidiphilus TaxID=1220600 RepID=A0A8J6YWW2_9PROT|nr:META domain-containing protein [Phaeovibrio sulfidiphilus]MBE1237949.1 META domain-containing protein [Phaeovibrio sulfidiphilus]